MDFDLEGALRRYPLPDGVEDAIVNRAQLAMALGVSEPIITKYLGQGLPVVTVGTNGQAYEFQLSECWAWRSWRDEQARSKREAGDRAAAQLAMMFRNDEDATPEDHGLTAAQIAEEADADYKRSRAAEARGELVRAERMRAMIEDMLTIVRNAMMALPDYCEMEFSLTPEQVEALQVRCDQALLQMAARARQDVIIPRGSVVGLDGVASSGGASECNDG